LKKSHPIGPLPDGTNSCRGTGQTIINGTVKPHNTRPPALAYAHGGVLASLIDLTGFYALIAQGTKVKATADLRVDYHRPATSGPLVATGLIVKVGQQISVAETSVTGPNEKLLASGRGAYICGDL
jgi:uncharacterized protein (TIGR00369 family)